MRKKRPKEEKIALELEGIPVLLTRKRVQNLRLSVHAPDGRVKMTIPFGLPIEYALKMLQQKKDWIIKQKSKYQDLPPNTLIEYKNGDTVQYLGKSYQLVAFSSTSKMLIRVTNDAIMEFYSPPNTSFEAKEKFFKNWCRQQLRILLQSLVLKWEEALGVKADVVGIKDMKTRWGTCNPKAKRIWLSLRLVQQPIHCIEYVVVHELVHFFERLHNQHFYSILAQHLPNWKELQDELNNKKPSNKSQPMSL